MSYELFVTFVTAMPVENDVQEISPLIQSFSIDNVNVPADFLIAYQAE